MAGRYHKTPFQNSTPVLPPFWRRQTSYGEEHVRSQRTAQVSVSSYQHSPRDAFSVSSYPCHYPVFVQALGLFLREQADTEATGKPFPSLPVENKFSLFSTILSFQTSSSPVVSEGVLPFQCTGSLVGLVPRRVCRLRARVPSRFAGGLHGPSRQ
jgi:hypothetical protein